MENNIKKIIKTSFSLFLGASIFFFSSCKIGLGEAIDLTAPEVSIVIPDFMANISANFEASGTAADNQAITKLTISFDDEQWIYENGIWNKPGASLENGIWKVNLSLPSGSGEYVLRVSATDAMNNTGAKSVASRTVVYDKEAPKVTVTQPSKLYASSDELQTAILGSNTYKDFTYISEFFNGESLSVQGYQDEKYSLKELTVKVTDSAGNEIYKKVLTDDLRNWSVTVPASSLGPSRNLYQVLTKSIDDAGNEEAEKSHGFFCWWPEADKPWIETAKLESTATIDSTSEANYYPGYKFQGQCYDDDGIKSVIVQLYDSSDNLITNGKYEFSTAKEDEMQSFYPWTITLPDTTGVVKLVANCTDKNNQTADTITGYLNVLDITIPRLEITEPVQTVSLFGDESGNAIFKGIARDDSGIASVKMVWLKNESDLLTYSRAENTLWNVSSGTVDVNGNKVWSVDLGPGKRESSQIEYEFSKEINIFGDLDIGTNKLTSQTFIFKVEDTSGKATTVTYAVQGDIKKPEISITKVFVKYSEDEIKELTPEDTISLSAFGENTLVKVEGTWSDDSTEIWTDKTKVSNTLSVEGLSNPTISINDNKWTTDYVKNAATGGLAVKATITDLAGSSSVAKASYAINTDEAEFEKITAANADGTYKAGDVITIQMKFTKAVTVTGNPVLKLSNGKEISLKASTNGTKVHEFEYTIQNGDSGSKINASIKNAASCTWKDSSSKSVVLVVVDNTNDLAYNKNIDIVTVAPTVSNVELNNTGNKLAVSFSSTIYKNLGDIVLTQNNVSAVPSVLTESEFKKLKNKDSNFENYYTKTTNGCDSTGKADLITKYVLKYEYDSNNSDLIRMYKAVKAHQVTMNVRSSNITVNGNEMEINLTGSYALPCKGAEYTVTIPEAFVTDVVGNKNAENKSYKVIMPGVEDPVIRVSTGSSSYNKSTFTATQPLTSEFKIDCETPKSSIKYGINSRSYDYTYHCETHDQNRDNGAENSDDNRYKDTSPVREYDPSVYANMDLGVGFDSVATSCPYPQQGTSPEEPATLGNTYSKAVKIGSNDWTCGEKYLIAAQAKAGENSSGKSYASANRSLFVFNNNNGVYCDTDSNQRIWLRGGDSETGGVMTAGFPLSWSPENGKPGIALMTQDTENNALWYYLTWELNTTAYVGVVRGEADVHSATDGAVQDTEAFGVNAWVPFKKWYCVYPGESRVVETKRYESVYGKHRDFFKWNEVFTGATVDSDTENMTIHAEMEAGYNTSTTEFDCIDIWQKTKIKKWGSDTSSEGAYLIIETATSSKSEENPYVDVWSYDYGSRVTVKKVNVIPGETVKIKFDETASNRWKWDDLYVGGLGVKVTKVQFKTPIHVFSWSNLDASQIKKGLQIVFTVGESDGLVDSSECYVSLKNGNIRLDVKLPIENGKAVYTVQGTENIYNFNSMTVYGYGVEITERVVKSPYHYFSWESLSDIKEGDVIELTIGDSDGIISSSDCYIKMFSNAPVSVTPNTVYQYTVTNTDKNNWEFKQASTEKVYGYGVKITERVVKSPYSIYTQHIDITWGNTVSIIVEFTKKDDFSIADSDCRLIHDYQTWTSYAVTDGDKVFDTAVKNEETGHYEYTFNATNSILDNYRGYGINILSVKKQ